ncbi:MAG: hypothetical protein C0394_09200 [Syntrophus sp. (in: bacteria)]|nr:hypothetical protein [Syntrophus sp. (in: bacteria)]
MAFISRQTAPPLSLSVHPVSSAESAFSDKTVNICKVRVFLMRSASWLLFYVIRHSHKEGHFTIKQRKEITMVSGISSSSSFSTASLSEMRQKMFNKIDTNGDGSIDKTEMSALLQQNTSQDTSSLVDKIFSKQDTDQNGLISLIESNSAMEKLAQEMKQGGGISAVSGMPPSPNKVFDTADTDKDGFVSKDELAAVMGKNGGNIDKLFSKADTDGDGLISRTEDETFRKQMTERMQQNDSANSGTNSNSGFVQDLQSKMFDALIKGLTAAVGSSGESTSLYA